MTKACSFIPASSAQITLTAQHPITLGVQLCPPSPALAARLLSLETGRIPHAAFEQAVRSIRELWETSPAHLPPPRPRARARLIYGASGAGVTAAIDEFGKGFGDKAGDGEPLSRIVRIKLPLVATLRNITDALAKALGLAPVSRNCSHRDVQDIADRIELLNVELLVFEKCQHAACPGAAESFVAFVKALLDLLSCNLLIAGSSRIAGMEGPGGLGSRVEGVDALLPYDLGTTEGRSEVIRLMDALEDLLGLEEPSCLGGYDFARRFYVASGGTVGAIVEYLRQALALAQRRRLPKIDLELMAEIYSAKHPRARPPLWTDFDLDCDFSGETLASLRARLARPSLDPEANPFSCSSEALSRLWTESALAQHADLGTGPWASSRRRASATSRASQGRLL